MSEASTPSVRTERVLDPAFTEGIAEMPMDELRRLRDETLAERDYQSYLRRLIQARQDLLVAERSRRQEGGVPPPMVERLTAVLATGPQGGSRGEALRLKIPDDDIEQAERRVAAVMGESLLAEPGSLSDDDLHRALTVLDEAERAVSHDRVAVFRVHDRLQDELKRRYRDDPSQVLSQR